MSVKDKTLCVVCNDYVNAGKGLRTDCGHWTHSECWRSIGKQKDFDNCPRCLGYVDDTTLDEPVTDDGVDYVMNPPTKNTLSMLRGAASQVLTVLSRKKRTDTANPFFLLSQGPYQMPIKSIIREHHIGLQHMIKAGVTIDDFLNNGYSIDDMLAFKDIGERGSQRAHQALWALQMTADHMRDYGDSLLSVNTLKEKLGVTPSIICTVFGLEFPPGGHPLRSPFSEDWTARDVVTLGLTMDDLLNHAGMEYQEQYFDLDPTTEDEVALKVQPSHASRLRSLEATIIEEEHPLERNVYIPKHIPDEEEEKKEDDNPYRVKRRTRHGLKLKPTKK